MIHLALSIAAFLFLCWVALMVLQLVGFALYGVLTAVCWPFELFARWIAKERAENLELQRSDDLLVGYDILHERYKDDDGSGPLRLLKILGVIGGLLLIYAVWAIYSA